jgi:hypothetical protein
MDALESLLYPQLNAFPPDERAGALKGARETSFDVVELIGIAAGLVLVTAITRYLLEIPSAAAGLLAALGNFAVALPLLIVFVGPFLVRRVRRGLDRELARRRPR